MTNKEKRSIFFQWVLNNKVVTGLLVLLLFLLNVLVFTKVSWVFRPVSQFVAIVGLPILLAVVFYYLLKPIVDYFEVRKVKRVITIAILFIVMVALLVIGLVVLIPSIEQQMTSFFRNIPKYVHILDNNSQELLSNTMFDPYRERLLDITNNLSDKAIEWAQTASSNIFIGVGEFVTAVTTVILGLITMPFILFYLLKDGKDLLPAILNRLPYAWRPSAKKVLIDMNTQISSYIRGQLTVAFAVSIMFIIGFNIIGLDYAVTLGISAGILNLIPYLGSFLAMVPAVILGIVAGPMMLVQVLIVFVIEQTLEGRLIAPLVLGNQLKIHPVTILLVLLTSGKVAGLIGVIIGIPLYAVIKVLVTHLYEWHREISGLYVEPEEDVSTEK